MRGLEAVAVVVVFSGDSVGELVEVGFAGDGGTEVEEALGYPGIFFGDGVLLGVEVRAEGGDSALEVEAVFQGDGDSVEGAWFCFLWWELGDVCVAGLGDGMRISLCGSALASTGRAGNAMIQSLAPFGLAPAFGRGVYALCAWLRGPRLKPWGT